MAITLLRNTLFSFITLGILFIPFTWKIFPSQLDLTLSIFYYPVKGMAHLFGIQLVGIDFSSDSRSLYLLVLILLIAAIGTGITSWQSKRIHTMYATNLPILSTLAVYYLAAILMIYGADKLFKAQFPLPEPNLLYTPLGKLDKDILYWSTMGSSYGYNLFTGISELFAAGLLFFRRTRFTGLVLSAGIFLNIVAINLSFDISVKLFSSFLLLITLILLLPQMTQFNRNRRLQVHPELNPQRPFLKNRTLYWILKTFVIILIFTEATGNYILNGQFNDDTAPRPALHGAYEVKEVISGSESAIRPENMPERIFVHRNGYLIFQDRSDNMEDFHLHIDQAIRSFKLTDYNGNVKFVPFSTDDEGKLNMISLNQEIQLMLDPLPTDSLPLLRPLFHWTAD